MIRILTYSLYTIVISRWCVAEILLWQNRYSFGVCCVLMLMIRDQFSVIQFTISASCFRWSHQPFCVSLFVCKMWQSVGSLLLFGCGRRRRRRRHPLFSSRAAAAASDSKQQRSSSCCSSLHVVGAVRWCVVRVCVINKYTTYWYTAVYCIASYYCCFLRRPTTYDV